MTQDYRTILPSGLQIFEDLRQSNAIYVDKTEFIPLLRETGKFIFCARPRRFGKSLMLNTLASYYSGNDKLFQGLAIENSMQNPDFTTHPVIKLDMSSAAGRRKIEFFEENITSYLRRIAKRYDISSISHDPANALFSLISDIHDTTGKKVVLLIDEYDAPLIRLVHDNNSSYNDDLFSDTHNSIEGLYSQIKPSEEHLEFVFITGITKFSGLGLFSTITNLTDISLMTKFSTIMGFTQEEFESNYIYFLNKSAEELQISKKFLLEKIRDYYNGFSFDGTTKLYNPESINSFFDFNKFGNYWLKAGTSNMLKKFLKDKVLTVDQFEGLEVDFNFVNNPYDIKDTPPHGLLYQTGCLTLRNKDRELYDLVYPNLEVRKTLSTLFLENLHLISQDVGKAGRDLAEHLAVINIVGMIDVLDTFFSGICYYDHANANANTKPEDSSFETIIREQGGKDLSGDSVRKLSSSLAEKIQNKKGESFYRSILHACLWMAGAKNSPEKQENLGRPDLEVTYGGLTYILELKMADDVITGPKATREGMEQMHDTGYGLSSENSILVSLAIGRKERNIVACTWENARKQISVITQAHLRYLKSLKKNNNI
jgi:hypothetical protein